MHRVLPLVVACVAWLQLAVPAACLAAPLDAGTAHCETAMPADHASDCPEMRADDRSSSVNGFAPPATGFSLVRPLALVLPLAAEPVSVLARTAARDHRATGPPPLLEFGRLRL